MSSPTIVSGQLANVSTRMQMRSSFQHAMEDEFRRVIEVATGRKVIAYMSTVHVDPDMAVELFVLEPVDEPVHAEGHEISAGDLTD